MKFTVRVKEMLNGLESAFAVATKGIVRDFVLAQLVTIEARTEGIFTYANGGRMNICSEISENTEDKANLQFNCEDPGKFTVRANDIKATLSSFTPNDIVCIELKTSSSDNNEDSEDSSEDETSAHVAVGQEVVCTLVSDPEQYQTVPCFREHISMPQFVTDFMETKTADSSFKIRRDLFVYAANKIIFARGFEESKPQYMYWIIRAAKNSLRFAAGSGAIFAVLDVLGDDISNIKKEKSLLIPNEQTQPLLEVISKATYNNEFVNFFVSDRWLIIECGSFRASIAGYDSDVKWPNENDFLTRKNSLVFTTKVNDWSNVVRGISATYNQDMKKQHDIHYATLDLNIGKKEITAKTEGMMKSSRKISVKDAQVLDKDMFKDGKFAFTCISQYIAEAIKNGSEDECIQIEAETSRKPILFRYYADSNGVVGDSSEFARANPVFGIKEKFSIFFAPKKQQD